MEQSPGFIDPSSIGAGNEKTHADADVYRRALNIDDEVWSKIIDDETTALANIRHQGVVYGPVPVVIMGEPQKRNITDDTTGKLTQKNMVKVKILASQAGQNAFKIDKDSESGYGKLPYKPEDKIMEIPIEDIINFGHATGQAPAPPAGAAPAAGGGMGLMASAQLTGFKQWINEVGTSTGSIAGFQRMVMPSVRRQWVTFPWNQEDPFFKKKKNR